MLHSTRSLFRTLPTIPSARSRFSVTQLRPFAVAAARKHTPPSSSSSLSVPPPPPVRKLLIYYAGSRTLLLASLKLSTLFLSTFCLIVAAPAVGGGGYGLFGVVGVALAGGVPLGFIQYLSPPYVTHAYLHLPPAAASYSQDALKRYVMRLPPRARLDLATMRLLGRPKVTTVEVGELSFTRKRLGCVNWEWRSGSGGKGEFYVEQGGSPASVPAPGVMEEVARRIRLRTVKNATGVSKGTE